MQGSYGRRSLRWTVGVGLLAVSIGAWLLTLQFSRRSPMDRLGSLPRAKVLRTDLDIAIKAPGHIDSSVKTLVECELESVTLSSDGRSLMAKGASTIIDLIPEGAEVKQGDVLCRFDASEFEELVRQQEIVVQRARADVQKARFEVDTAQMALVEYRDGLLPEDRAEIDGQLTLAQSDIERQRDRVDWTERMVRNRYASEGQLMRERQILLRSKITLDRTKRQRDILDRYSAKASLIRMQGLVDRMKSELAFQFLRLKRREEQLAKFQQQVDRCVVRAPHDGIVVYANEADNDPRIELGARVYQKMDLFYLPDLKHMDVVTRLNESVVGRVAANMPAIVRVEALPGTEIRGRVMSVMPLPLPAIGRLSPDVRTYVARVKLDDAPVGLKPGMSAEVTVVTDRHTDAIVVPSTSVHFEEGKEFCFIPKEWGIERRPVDVASATPDLLEVRRGLEPGEEVLLDPTQADDALEQAEQHACAPPAVDSSTHGKREIAP